MLRLRFAAVILAFVMAFAAGSPVLALGGKARIAGMSVECTDFRGRKVLTMRVGNLGDVGRAWVVNTMPYILMDRELLAELPPKLQLFFYLHECGHHVLGHWVQLTSMSEREADCWSVKKGRDERLFSRDEVAAFAPYFKKSLGSAWGHLPGPKRVAYLLRCFDQPGMSVKNTRLFRPDAR